MTLVEPLGIRNERMRRSDELHGRCDTIDLEIIGRSHPQVGRERFRNPIEVELQRAFHGYARIEQCLDIDAVRTENRHEHALAVIAQLERQAIPIGLEHAHDAAGLHAAAFHLLATAKEIGDCDHLSFGQDAATALDNLEILERHASQAGAGVVFPIESTAHDDAFARLRQ